MKEEKRKRKDMHREHTLLISIFSYVSLYVDHVLNSGTGKALGPRGGGTGKGGRGNSPGK